MINNTRRQLIGLLVAGSAVNLAAARQTAAAKPLPELTWEEYYPGAWEAYKDYEGWTWRCVVWTNEGSQTIWSRVTQGFYRKDCLEDEPERFYFQKREVGIDQAKATCQQMIVRLTEARLAD